MPMNRIMFNNIFAKSNYLVDFIYKNYSVKEKSKKLFPIICIILLITYFLPSFVNILLVVSVLLPIVYIFPKLLYFILLSCFYIPFRVTCVLFPAIFILFLIVRFLEKGSRNQEKEHRCIKCTEIINIDALLNITDQCIHNNICRMCINDYIESEVDKSNVKILCPENECRKALNENDIKKFASERVFGRYETLMLNFALSQISTFKWCLNPTCRSGQDHYQGDDVPIMICNLCGQKSCIIHELLIETECEKCKEHLGSVLKEERKECIICTENFNVMAFLNITDLCNHDRRICRECVGEYIKHELEDNGKIRISCPEDECSEILDQKDVREFASEDVFKRYEKFTLNFVLSQIPTFQWCLNPNCGSGQDHFQGDNVPIMICNSCGQKSCVLHGHPIDTVCEECTQQEEGFTREEEEEHRRQEEEERRRQEEHRRQEEEERRRQEEHRRQEELRRREEEERRRQDEHRLATLRNAESASESYVGQLKQCPKCASRIEKNAGCDHMTCRCGHQFCWA
ncbi:852_t:CDS:2 [Cetraspora pellucida]|uniref:RBR-type E3 ubiquitin transferase n=1 Tax=Cetraspora pellucida TaxID=1433469 RepID=A0A9N8ZVM6_9GLOM|nr:852_t:CDS:2 [Cetraspora pellucida]